MKLVVYLLRAFGDSEKNALLVPERLVVILIFRELVGMFIFNSFYLCLVLSHEVQYKQQQISIYFMKNTFF